jgi:hypothetical protein
VRAAACHGSDEQDCIGTIAVRPLGCDDRLLATIPLVPGTETRWTVDLDAGGYELDVFAYFETNDGLTGDVSGSLGLLVAADRPTDVIPVGADHAVCPFSD